MRSKVHNEIPGRPIDFSQEKRPDSGSCHCGVLGVVQLGITPRLAKTIQEILGKQDSWEFANATERLLTDPGYLRSPTRCLVEATLQAVLQMANSQETPGAK
jgi:hypothetical protein